MCVVSWKNGRLVLYMLSLRLRGYRRRLIVLNYFVGFVSGMFVPLLLAFAYIWKEER
jgi:hypothetical protein